LDFEKGLFEFIDTQYPELFAKIRDEKKLTDEIEEMLQKAIVEFKEQR
jgi:F-type H+-transporting ATPase subunit alpha